MYFIETLTNIKSKICYGPFTSEDAAKRYANRKTLRQFIIVPLLESGDCMDED